MLISISEFTDEYFIALLIRFDTTVPTRYLSLKSFIFSGSL